MTGDRYVRMIDRFGGRGPEGLRCGDCAALQPTATGDQPPHPGRMRPFTTFVCARAETPTAWSVLWPACGAFQPLAAESPHAPQLQ